jgi:WD40 repeat protein
MQAYRKDTVDLATGEEFHKYSHLPGVHICCFHPDGRRVLSDRRDAEGHSLIVWELDSGNVVNKICDLPVVHVTCLLIHPDRRRVIVSLLNKVITVWDINEGKEVAALTGHSESVNALAMTADGTRLISASDDKTIRVWHLDSGVELQCLEGHTKAIYSVSLFSDEWRVLSLGADSSLRVWDLRTGRATRVLPTNTFIATGATVLPDGRHALMKSFEPDVQLLDLDGQPEFGRPLEHSFLIKYIVITSRGCVLSASSDQLRIWDRDTGAARGELSGADGEITGLAATPDGEWALATDQESLKLWNLASGEHQGLFARSNGCVALLLVPSCAHQGRTRQNLGLRRRPPDIFSQRTQLLP